MEEFIGPLVAYLVNELNSESHLIQSTSLWTVSKFASWTSSNLSDQDFSHYMQAITQKLGSPNPNIQETACTSLAFTF
jgi:hypothetical protein